MCKKPFLETTWEQPLRLPTTFSTLAKKYKCIQQEKKKEWNKVCNVFESVTFYYYGCAMMNDLLVTFMGVVLKVETLN